MTIELGSLVTNPLVLTIASFLGTELVKVLTERLVGNVNNKLWMAVATAIGTLLTVVQTSNPFVGILVGIASTVVHDFLTPPRPGPAPTVPS